MLCLSIVLVEYDKFIVFGGDHDVVGKVIWILDQGHVDHLLFNQYLVHTKVTGLVGQVE